MQTIGGFSIVRRLGSGSRAHVYLGRSEMESAPLTVAIKAFHAATDTASIQAEVEALSRTDSPHLLRVDDLALDDHGRPALILPRVNGPSLAALLVDRGTLRPGEAVTILAPLASAVGALHRTGVAHGGIRCSRVLFDDAGAPVLVGFGRAVSTLSSSEVASTPSAADPSTPEVRNAVSADLIDLAALARTVLEASAAGDPGRFLIGWLAAIATSPEGIRGDFADELRDRVFDLAAPTAIDFSARAASVAPIPARVSSGLVEQHGRRALRARPPQPHAPSAWATMFLPEWITTMIGERESSTNGGGAARTLDAARRFLAPVRAPVWWSAGIVGGLLVAALVLVPGPEGREAGAVGLPPSASPRATPPSPGSVVPSVPPSDGAIAPTALHHDSAEFDVAIRGVDEVTAASALLRARESCLAGGTPGCLDRVDQQDSAVLDNDLRLLDQGAGGRAGALQEDFSTWTPVLIERLGASALLRLDPPPGHAAASGQQTPAMSVLIVHGTDGWRIRDLIVGGEVP